MNAQGKTGWRRGATRIPWAALSLLAVAPFTMIVVLHGQSLARLPAALATDPGVRGGKAGGGPTSLLPGLTSDQLSVLPQFEATFNETNSVVSTLGGLTGLGPGFDSNSCASCHLQPADFGSSPATNPLFAVFQLQGATNTMPAFETSAGPTLVARFPFKSDLVTPDGHVQQLFTIAGRSDAAGCTAVQPDFALAAQQNNLINRSVLPIFGDGLIEIIQDSDLLANLNANLSQKLLLGISGHPNRASDGSINRFGWKAQARSLLIFSGAAYNIEEGVTNEISPTEINETAGCIFNSVPEDHTNYTTASKKFLPPRRFVGDPEGQATASSFLAGPVPGQCPGGKPSSCTNGQTQFNNIGCVLCHTTSFTTPAASVAAKGNVPLNLFSDLLVHDMGPCLADNVTQGQATGDQFRTPPLWGVGQRIFFLHDGRTTDIVQAVEDHFCDGNSQYPNSESNAVINNFNALSGTNQQDLINFLRSL